MTTVVSVPLPEVVTIVMGQSPPGDTYNELGEGLPFFQGKSEFGAISPTPKKWCTAPKRLAEAGDILMSVRAPVGPTNLAFERCCIGRGLAAIRADGARLDPSYLRFFLRYVEPVLAGMGQGSTFAAIGRAEIASLHIPLPPIPEQRRIVDLLSRAENILRLRREAQTTAQAIIPALFLDMFGDPATNPKGWSVRPLGSLADVQGGLQVTRARETLPIERPYLRVANVYRDNLDLTEVKTIRMTEAEWLRTELRPGDLLIVEGHGNPQEVGRVAVWGGQIPDCTHQNHLIRARPDSASLLPSYACALLNSASGRQALVRSGKTTSGLSTISARNVKETPVMLPPLEAQKRFDERGRTIQSIVAQQAVAVEKAKAAFQSLLARGFRGRARER